VSSILNRFSIVAPATSERRRPPLESVAQLMRFGEHREPVEHRIQRRCAQGAFEPPVHQRSISRPR
jgi:hypothetical protein